MCRPMIARTMDWNAIAVDAWAGAVVWSCRKATVTGTQVTKSNYRWHEPIYETIGEKGRFHL